MKREELRKMDQRTKKVKTVQKNLHPRDGINKLKNDADNSTTLRIAWIFGLVGFYGMSTIVGYLMLNLVYTYVLNIYDFVGLVFMEYHPL